MRGCVLSLVRAKVVATDGVAGVMPVLEENLEKHTINATHPVKPLLLSWGEVGTLTFSYSWTRNLL